MSDMSVRSRVVSGACVIVASLFSSGCVSLQPTTQAMPWVDLDRFTIDCRIKEQQVRLLQSMRITNDDRLVYHMNNVTQPWQRFTRPDTWDERQRLSTGRTNWLINQHLMLLNRNCP